MTCTTCDIRTTTDGRQTTPRRPTTAREHPGAAAGVLRLTARGRVVVILVVLAAALAVFALQGAPAASSDIVHHQRTSTVVVSPGETVWDIARRVAPDADPRAVVAEIEELNSLADAGSIRVGQPLSVPRRQ